MEIDRVVLIVLDSVGVGALPDANKFGDVGSNTLGNIAQRVALELPNLQAMGLGNIVPLKGILPQENPTAFFLERQKNWLLEKIQVQAIGK